MTLDLSDLVRREIEVSKSEQYSKLQQISDKPNLLKTNFATVLTSWIGSSILFRVIFKQ